MDPPRKRQRFTNEKQSTAGTREDYNGRDISGSPCGDSAASKLFEIIETISSECPSDIKGVCWLKQLYEATGHYGKTWVDGALEKLKEIKLVRLIVTHAQTPKFGAAILLHGPYIKEVKIVWQNAMLHQVKDNAERGLENPHTRLCDALSKYIAFLEKSSASSVTLNELIDEHSFNKEEVLSLVTAKFILPRRDVDLEGVYWIYWPHLAPVMARLTSMRTTVITAMTRSRYKEIAESSLKKLLEKGVTVTRGGGLSPSGFMRYYVLDLLGNRLVKSVVTPSGKIVYRLTN